MTSGSFENDAGQEFEWTLLEVHDYEDNVFSEGDAEDMLHEADRAFYTITRVSDGEIFHRWVAGPFESIGDLESAISDEADFYSALG